MNEILPGPSPHNLEAERALLGAALLDPTAIPILLTLPTAAFHTDKNRDVHVAIAALHQAGQAVDSITVTAELERRGQLEAVGGRAYLAVLLDEGAVATALPEYAELVREEARKRVIARTAAAALNGSGSAGILEQLERELSELTSDGAAGAPPYLESLAAFLSEDDPPVSVVFPELLPAGVIMLLHGEPRSRKSLGAFELALAAATGTAPFGLERFRPAGPIGVLYVQEEDPRSLTRPRVRRLVTERCGAETPPTLYVSVRRGVDLDDPAWVTRVIEDVSHLGVRLLVLDAARRFSAKTDEGPAKVREFTGVLRRIVTATGVAIIIVHHDVKPSRDGQDTRRRSQRASGADWFAVSECPVHVERVSETETLVYPQDYKFAADPASFTFTCISDGRLIKALVGRDTTSQHAETAGARGKLLAWLRANGPATRTAIRKAGFAWMTVEGLLDELMRTGDVDAHPGRQKDSLVYFATGVVTGGMGRESSRNGDDS